MTGSLASRPLGPLSPSLLEQLTCLLRVAFTQSRADRQRPQRQTAPALLGDIAPDTIEAALRGAEINHAGTAAAESRKTADVPSPDALPTARRMRFRIRKRLTALTSARWPTILRSSGARATRPTNDWPSANSNVGMTIRLGLEQWPRCNGLVRITSRALGRFRTVRAWR